MRWRTYVLDFAIARTDNATKLLWQEIKDRRTAGIALISESLLADERRCAAFANCGMTCECICHVMVTMQFLIEIKFRAILGFVLKTEEWMNSQNTPQQKMSLSTISRSNNGD